MKALNVRPGTKLADHDDSRGYRLVTKRENTAEHTVLTFDTGHVVRYRPDEVLTVFCCNPSSGQATWLEFNGNRVHTNAPDVLAAVYRELRSLLDGDVDAPNVWRWTAMRLTRRVAEVLPVEALRKPVPDPWSTTGPEDSTQSGPSA